ncbi:MAG: hypothetical protein M0Q94_16585 [Candidatus Cloacimonetes bacterium]|nr:hypothetical protein [Candidatus Cloacimonadota bacterium]
MSRVKNLINILESTEKHEFDKIVKTYLKEIYNYIRIIITDGKDDTGIDIKVFDLNGQNVQYQLTTQKSNTAQEKKQLEYKIFDDFKKAKDNNDNHGYSSNLFYFYSRTLTNKAIRDYKKIALQKFSINLEIIDAKQIAEESEEYLELQKAIYDTSGLSDFKVKDSQFTDKNKNIVYELISFGKPADLRLHIVESFVLQLLFEKTQLGFDVIVELCMDKFNAKENKVFYEKLLARLQTSKKIKLDKELSVYQLTTEEQNRIDGLLKQTELDENYFLTSITEILSKYNQADKIVEYIDHLKKIYSDNFNSDIIDVINNSSSSDLTGISRDFINYISRVLDADFSPKKLALELFTFCDENKYIQKISAGKVFSEQTNLSRLESYVNTQKQIYIDTPLALHALCYYYRPKCSYDNYFFRTTYSLIEFCRKKEISLHIPNYYLWEAQNHVRDALNLIPFTFLPEFHKLGKSRNVFYNFYLFLKNECDDIQVSYESFLAEFGFKQYDSYRVHNQIIEKYLNDLGIYKYQIEDEYDIEETKKLIQSQLIADTKYKTKFGLNNDSIMLDFLADDDIEVHPLKPVFLTWDKTIFKVQSKYFEKYPTSQRWLLFTPSKLIDHYSLLNFSIDSETVTREVIALLSDEIIQNTHSLLDSLIFILNPKDEVGLEYTRRLATIRDEEIYKVRDNQIIPPDDIEGEVVIDDVFYKLTTHYRENENNINQFKKVFTKKEYIEDVINLLIDTVMDYYESKHFDEKAIEKFDEIINRMTIEEKKRITRGHSQ